MRFSLIAAILMTALTPAMFVTAAPPAEIEERFEQFDGDHMFLSYPTRWAGSELRVRELQVTNGTLLQSQEKWERPLTSFKWTWAGTDRGTADILRIYVRWNGKLGNEYPREITHGIIVSIDAGTGELKAVAMNGDKIDELGKVVVAIEKDETKPAIPEGAGANWYQLVVQDDGKGALEIFFRDPEKAVLTVRYDPTIFPAGKLGIRNASKKNEEELVRMSYIKELFIKERK